MAIHYDFYKTTGHYADEKKPWHVRLVQNGTTETEDMMQRIETGTTLTMADLKGALDAFVSQITQSLEDGRAVHIDGLGHFSLSIGGEVQETEDGKLRLKHAAVRSVNFRPEPSLLRRLSSATFTSKDHRGRHSAALNEAELPTTLAALCEEKGHFTTHDFRRAFHLTHSTAQRRLQSLCDDGVIENAGSPRFALYRMKGE